MKTMTMFKIATASLFFISGATLAASVVNSSHDLSLVNTSTAEVCVFCHTPHSSVVGQQPLWNKTVTGTTFVLYTSDTLDAVTGQPAGTSRLCLSCHDGTLAVDSVVNPPNGGTFTQGTTLIGAINASVDLGNDLSNDHPISMTYDNELITGGFVTAAAGSVGGTLPLFGVGTDQVECASCHDVHDNQFVPFLRVDNADSALCTTCHVK